MGLHEWQRALSAMIIAPDGQPPRLADAGLSAEERRWLCATADDPGLRITRHAQRSWRRMRLANALPMTMRMMSAETRDRAIEHYIDRVPCVSFFHAHEGRGFARFLATHHAATEPHVVALAAFEVAVTDAMEYVLFETTRRRAQRLDASARPALHPAATLVNFAARPELVIAAAIGAIEPPPPEDHPHVLLVAPGLPNLARVLDPAELLRLQTCTSVPLIEFLEQPGHAAWLDELVAQQVLITA
jgi:hypothetical protein